MHLQFTEEQLLLQKMVRDFAEKEIAPFVSNMEAGQFPRQLIEKMGELGLMGIPIPIEYGGTGMDFTAYMMAIHEIAKVSPTLAVILSVHTSVGTYPILNFGTEEQKQQYIPKLASGKYLGAFCLTEPNAGSDVGSLSTRAVKDGDHYVINGSKIFITNGGEADVYIVFVKTNPALGSKGISAFIVEKIHRVLSSVKMSKRWACMVPKQSKLCLIIFVSMKVNGSAKKEKAIKLPWPTLMRDELELPPKL